MMSLGCSVLPVIDTSAPVIGEKGVREVIYDEFFETLVIYYNLTDHESGIRELYIGLGRTQHDVEILMYQPITDRIQLDQMFAGLYELVLPDGVPVWPRIRATNNGEK
jgi:hypothetical protein